MDQSDPVQGRSPRSLRRPVDRAPDRDAGVVGPGVDATEPVDGLGRLPLDLGGDLMG
jgi:hypothetical protein